VAAGKGPAVSVSGTSPAGPSDGGPGLVNGGTMPAAWTVTVPAAGLDPGPLARLGRLSPPNAGRHSRTAGKPGRRAR